MRERSDVERKIKKGIRGITLIALVVTIVVLLILAGVSINLLIGNNGIITRAGEAKRETEHAMQNEQADLLGLEGEINKFTYDPASEGIPIPVGFYYVGGTKNSGLVISDNSDDENKYAGQTTVGTDLAGNQFVWIPVTYSNFHLIEGYSNKSLQPYLSRATNPSREAGATATAGTPLANNSTAGTAESIAMYKSVQDNGGFYIARYEAGIANVDTDGNPVDNYSLETKVVATGDVKPLSKAGKGVWNSIAWGGTSSNTASDGLPGDDSADGAVKVARSMYTKSSTCGVTSTLCYGVQWDAVMQFLDSNYLTGNCANDSFVKNSTNKGNYSGSLKPTGSDSKYVQKNIYDLAGNVYEWTMEAHSSFGRVLRGSCYDESGSSSPASFRNCTTRSCRQQLLLWFPCSFIFVNLFPNSETLEKRNS